MKVRQGFVSNSSSSSFVIALEYLNGKQVEQLKMHLEVAKEMDEDFGWTRKYDEWNVHATNESLTGSCTMDNFDMHKFMEVIGVDMDKVDWGY